MSPALRRRSSVLAGLLLSLVLAGCASTGQSGNVMQDPGGFEGEDVQITVQNNDFRDATIYAHWNGVKHRVGTVTGKTTDSFEVDWRSEELRLEADFVGGGGFWSDLIAVYQGDHLDFVILPQW